MTKEQPIITDQYAIYNSDAIPVLSQLPSNSVGLSVYSPPFPRESGGCLYHYSSSERDLSNCKDYDEFFKQYEFIVEQISRITMPGRSSLVHCIDIPSGNSGHNDYLIDFPGDIIRLHEKHGFRYCGRYHIWKEPLGVRNRTMAKNLTHATIVEDSNEAGLASADYLLRFRKTGKDVVPVSHPTGLMGYAGSTPIPPDLLQYRGWTGNQIYNRYSQWIWRQYASSHWLDVRLDRVLPYREARDSEDEKHVHPLQLDVIERAIVMWSNSGEVVLTPFMGVGSEVCAALANGRKAVGVELKPSYFRQTIRNVDHVLNYGLFDEIPNGTLGFDDAENPEEKLETAL